MGSAGDGGAAVRCAYELDRKGRATGNVVMTANDGSREMVITDNVYKAAPVTGRGRVVIDLRNSKGWYDLTVKVNGIEGFEHRFAGRVETGKEGISDPFMGRVV
jgi:phospholipase C